MYLAGQGYQQKRKSRGGFKKTVVRVLVIALLLIAAFVGYKVLVSVFSKQGVEALRFDSSVTTQEQQTIRDAVQKHNESFKGAVFAKTQTSLAVDDATHVLTAYVPVTDAYAVRQQIQKSELDGVDLFVPAGLDTAVRGAIASALGVDASALADLEGDVADDAVAFIPVSELSPKVKLLTFDGAYYLDSFTSGAVFRQATFEGRGSDELTQLKLNEYATKDTTLKVNMTGVTALTRVMMNKLNSVSDATYFSEKIGEFLADADITHVSNEVSFKEGCTYHAALFCSPPKMIEALKASGVDVVELTGNHNNDVGSQYNAETIKLYHSLGWGTFGGGLNAEEAAKPYVADKKGSKVVFLGYNFADAPGSGAIAKADMAGANPYSAEKVRADIAAAKQQGAFVIVDIQFWECYAYPDGYVEFPECDLPIGQQTSVFRQVADFGADMVIGSSAHQPQTYELYEGVPIYYGLGNLYFEQTSWPGTERGIILTHYFSAGKLIQTKLSPTVYGKELQTRLMTADETTYQLQRLKTARTNAGL